MKLKKIIQIAIIIFLIITAKSCCSAKYVFEHEEKAFEINIIQDDIFLAEMGAFKIGDIKETSKIVKPKYGIITTIGQAHLESFGQPASLLLIQLLSGC